MYQRTLSRSIQHFRKQYPVLAIVGPRQSGKTTLVQYLFSDYDYVSLESIDNRRQAEEDPRGFFADHGARLIIDEAQRVPDLFSYVQEIVDKKGSQSQFVLTGSQQFLLLERISQSLAGRIATFKLFPFTWDELSRQPGRSTLPNMTSRKKPVNMGKDLDKILFTGSYPRIHDKKLQPRKWSENYVQTYLERDIRSILNVADLRSFEIFLTMCAAFSGSLLNYASLANSVGVSQPTIKRWVSLLETSGVAFLLRPHHRNFGKRVVKTPKIYFCDSGLLCFLLSLRDPKELKGHPMRGHVFETFVVAEVMKRYHHLAETPPVFFWRDKTGNEIDLVVDSGATLFPVEIKSAKTHNASFADMLNKWATLKKNDASNGFIIYAGEKIIGSTSQFPTLPWQLL